MPNIDLVRAVSDLDETLALKGVKERLAFGIPASEILIQLQYGMEFVGNRYQAGEYFLSELILAASVFTAAAGLLEEAIAMDGDAQKLGVIVIGTVKDDIHDIGKKIVVAMLNCNGFKVVDLGVDVSPREFAAAVAAHRPVAVCICCLLTSTINNVWESVAAAKVFDRSVTVLVGGGPLNEKIARECGADGYCSNACDAVIMARKATRSTELLAPVIK